MTKTQKAQSAIDDLVRKLDAMQARRRSLMAQAVGLESRRDAPAAIAQAQATRQAVTAIEEDISIIEGRDLPAARGRLAMVEEERRALAQSIEDTERKIQPYAARLDVMERAAALLLEEIRRAGDGNSENDRRALALLLWIRGLITDRDNLPGWRAKLARDY